MRKADADPGIEAEPELKTEVKTGGQREAEADVAPAKSEVEELG